jgi:hypothetical protein
MELRVYHRLYTHAAKANGTTGGHIVGLADVDIAQHLPQPVTEAVDRLLFSLSPSGVDPAYAVRRFAAHGGSIVCLAVSYPNIVADGLGRAGALSHARAVHLSSDDAWLDVDALLDCAAAISMEQVAAGRDSQARLNTYVDQLESETDVARWHPNAVQSMDFDVLREAMSVMTAVAATSGAASVWSRIACSGSGDAAHLLAAAWCSLPAALQISCWWALDAEDDVAAKVLFSRGDAPRAEVAPRARDLAQRILRLIVDGGLDVPSLLGKRPVGSVDQLEGALRDLEGAATLGAISSGGGGVGSTIAKTPEVAPVAKNEEDQRDPTAAAEVVRQQLATFDERFRKYLDDRLKLHDAARQYQAPVPMPLAPLADGTPPVVPPEPVAQPAARWLKPTVLILAASIAGFAFIAIVLAGVFTNVALSRRLQSVQAKLQEVERRLPPRTGLQQQQRGTHGVAEGASSLPTKPRFEVEGITGNTWRDRLKWVMQNRRELLLPLSQELEKSPSAAEGVRNEVKALMRARQLGQTNRLRLRQFLYEAVVAEGLKPPARIAIDGDTRDVTAEMAESVRKALGVATDPSATDDFMAEVVLRRAAR